MDPFEVIGMMIACKQIHPPKPNSLVTCCDLFAGSTPKLLKDTPVKHGTQVIQPQGHVLCIKTEGSTACQEPPCESWDKWLFRGISREESRGVQWSFAW